MSKRKLLLIIIGLLLVVVPFFVNIYSIYKLISLGFGIILLDVSFAIKEKGNKFILIYLPILLLIFTYGIDYLKTYALNLSSIFVLENEINDNVSIYNSLFYRIYKCNDKYIFDNNYKKNFACDTHLIENIDINKLLNEPSVSYKEYKNNFLKVTGKISRIAGSSSIELQEYNESKKSINGYVKFNETSKLIINLNGVNLTNYKIYDYITVVGYLESFNKEGNILTLTDAKIEENNLYANFDIQVIEKENCLENLIEYTDNFYTKCIENIYLDYKVDKYELSYAIKDGKVTLNSLIKDVKFKENNDQKIYEFEKFNILSCDENKNILLSKNEKEDYTLCEE